jgi:hypothetical protein
MTVARGVGLTAPNPERNLDRKYRAQQSHHAYMDGEVPALIKAFSKNAENGHCTCCLIQVLHFPLSDQPLKNDLGDGTDSTNRLWTLRECLALESLDAPPSRN